MIWNNLNPTFLLFCISEVADRNFTDQPYVPSDSVSFPGSLPVKALFLNPFYNTNLLIICGIYFDYKTSECFPCTLDVKHCEKWFIPDYNAKMNMKTWPAGLPPVSFYNSDSPVESAWTTFEACSGTCR